MRILVLCLLLSFSLFALDETAFKERHYQSPKREQAVIITGEGYYPQKLTIFEGERIHFFVSSTLDSSSCLIMPSHQLYISVERGKMAEGEALFEDKGHYTFYCPAGKIKGEIIVLAKPELADEESKARREVASTNKVQVWRPRED